MSHEALIAFEIFLYLYLLVNNIEAQWLSHQTTDSNPENDYDRGNCLYVFGYNYILIFLK